MSLTVSNLGAEVGLKTLRAATFTLLASGKWSESPSVVMLLRG
jgi:hypothetical protein